MDSTTLGVIGAAYGAALGAGLLRVRRNTPADTLLAALFATIATAIAAIVTQHDSRLRAIAPLLDRLDIIAAFIASPLLLLYCRGSQLRRADLLHAIPAVAALFVAVPIQAVIVYQAGYTAAAALTFRRTRHEADPFHRVVAQFLLVSFCLIHVAQVIRLLWRDVGPLRNVVAVVGSAVVLFFGLVLALRGGAAARLVARYRNSPLEEQEASGTLERLDELMRSDALYRDPALTLAALAERLSVTSHHLSQSLNQHRRSTLVEYLAVWRVEEAKRQLLDPARDNVTIDAIAESAGFGSRSAFYGAFRRLAGASPSEVRRLSRSGQTN